MPRARHSAGYSDYGWLTGLVSELLLNPSAPGTRMYFGMPGSGKSWLARHDALASGRRLLVIDTTCKDDWINRRTKYLPPDVRAWLRAGRARRMAVVSDFSGYRDEWKKGTPLIVVQASSDDEKAAILANAVKQEGIAIVIHETHTLNHEAMGSVDYIATQWRHHELAAFLDSQRPARIPTTVKELATQTHVFTLVGPRDRAACEEIVTGDVSAFARVHAQVCALHSKGVRGAHVALDETRAGPYTVRQVRS